LNFATATTSYNTAVGARAGEASTTATHNTLIGALAGDALTTGSSNVAVGYLALSTDDVGQHNVAIGRQALENLNIATASNTYNVAVGSSAGAAVNTGVQNTILGGSTASTLTTGSNNVVIGYFSNVSAAAAANQSVLGFGVTCVGNGNFTFGDGTTDSNIANGATSITAPSDERYKENIADTTAGLSFINDLRPVTFQWKKEKDIPSDHRSYVADSDKRVMNSNGETNHGFIAQEVKTAIDNHTELKDGFDMWMEDDTDGRQRVAPAALIPMLVKAIQELSAEIETLKSGG
jgi:hypothetical protein